MMNKQINIGLTSHFFKSMAALVLLFTEVSLASGSVLQGTTTEGPCSQVINKRFGSLMFRPNANVTFESVDVTDTYQAFELKPGEYTNVNVAAVTLVETDAPVILENFIYVQKDTYISKNKTQVSSCTKYGLPELLTRVRGAFSFKDLGSVTSNLPPTLQIEFSGSGSYCYNQGRFTKSSPLKMVFHLGSDTELHVQSVKTGALEYCEED